MAQTVLRSAAVIIIVTLVGRVVGLLRETLLAYHFGTSFAVDAYRYAFAIPTMIFLFVPGALNAIFVPSVKSMLVENRREEAQALFRKMLTVTTLIYFVIMVFGMLFSREIMQVMTFMQQNSEAITPEQRAQQLEMGTRMLQMMWPSAVFIALIGVFQATLNAHQQFFIPQMSTVVNSVVVCAAYLLFVPFYDIYGVAIGTTLGFLFAALSMAYSIKKEQYSFVPDFRWKDEEMKKIGERFLPIMLGSLITQVYTFIYPVLASGLGPGRVAALGYANTIYQLPMAIFVAAFTLPIYPYLVEYFTKGELDKMKQSITEGMRYLFILLVPVTVAMAIIPDELVSLLFYTGPRGEFNLQSIELTATALLYMGIGLFFLAVRDLLTRAFYAMENTKITVIAAVVGIIINVVFSLALIPYLSHGGVALGTSLGSLANMLLLAFFLRRSIGSFVRREFWMTAGKTVVAAAVMGVGLYAATSLLVFQGVWVQKMYIIFLIAAGAGVFFATLVMMREPLAVQIIGRFAGKIVKRKRG
ncbi:murein biosynthesis integral membrane protein MurJ [Aneurinibacillus thermoaerophilus]|uniref:murein biosynthesis integral membrane protein MurJ n=1 Tax=Aneurinibacillus thermoaerophilus TaxID=143495 RepID=UPI002E233B63|nr:murein biosynthesis integral membrane protein MurJ [Aneurinibacillus thermoaerophilus]MED0677001.1 murein biosynthesis integral membrane protein MurJ [Aneurinibacillus thermoaerophilus]